MSLQEFPLLIDLDEFVVVLTDEPISRWHVFITWIRRDGHGMGAQLIELGFGTHSIGAKDDAEESGCSGDRPIPSCDWDCC